ncbi:extracellular solute-binding protein [Polycladidibacter stylochi]|uniref:extracellular solute-binding protein n=1 Tax=Polycladidibacter stylochi TaxID=1807766 RepID=UPI001FCB8EC3|nr:extracellular solute-binding protein [Pseudovibrio stylochi]
MHKKTIRTMVWLFLTSILICNQPALAASSQANPDNAQQKVEQNLPWHHGISTVGALKYKKGFKRFDYVNPNAPKGGVIRMPDYGSFDTLNPVLPKGTPPLGLPLHSLNLIYDTLMAPSLDEVSSEYGLIAEALQYPADLSWAKFRLNPAAKWHDGKPITPEDVIWSFNTIRKYNPQYQGYYADVAKAEQTGPHEVKFTFSIKDNIELPLIMGQVLVLPKHWWTGKDADGNRRDISKTTLEPPLGSGAYKIAKVTPSRSIVYERVDDYWAKDLPVNVGQYNFDQIRFEVFRDQTVSLEALKADQIDWRKEYTARIWSTAYDFAAINNGSVVKESYDQASKGSGTMRGFIPNLRREKFKDIRVREALAYAFNFEELNKDIFYGLYSHIDSYFFDSKLAARGIPTGKELEVLKPYQNQLPEELFTQPFKNVSYNQPADERKNLRQALQLLKAAGYERKGTQLVNAKTGEPFTIELLMHSNQLERIALRYQTSLRKLGIELVLRPVDTSQYVNRVRNRDFDMIYLGWNQSLRPGNEQRYFFGSQAADNPASPNYGGIKNPIIDALIEKLVLAETYEDVIAVTHAIDRVLLWNHYIIPGWTSLSDFYAHWDRFSHPQPLPEQSIGFPTIWWYDAKKAAAVKKEND